MYCSKCGKEVEKEWDYCNFCGEHLKIEKKEDLKEMLEENEQKDEIKNKKVNDKENIKKFINNSYNKISSRLKNLSRKNIIIVICVIFVCLLFSIFFNKNQINSETVLTALLQSENGQYLVKDTLKIGSVIDFNYENYNKLISCSVTYHNGINSAELGELLLYKDKDNYKKVTLDANLADIIYNLNINNERKKLQDTTKVIGKFIIQNGTEIAELYYSDEYIQLGKEIGSKIGIENARKIVKNGFKKLAISSEIENFDWYFKKDEIFPSYYGTNITETVWDHSYQISKDKMEFYYKYKMDFYNQLVSLYGNPYIDETKYTVFTYGKNMEEVGTYENKESVMKELNVEQ